LSYLTVIHRFCICIVIGISRVDGCSAGWHQCLLDHRQLSQSLSESVASVWRSLLCAPMLWLTAFRNSICSLACGFSRPTYHSFPHYSNGDYVTSCYPYKWCSRVFQSCFSTPANLVSRFPVPRFQSPDVIILLRRHNSRRIYKRQLSEPAAVRFVSSKWVERLRALCLRWSRQQLAEFLRCFEAMESYGGTHGISRQTEGCRRFLHSSPVKYYHRNCHQHSPCSESSG